MKQRLVLGLALPNHQDLPAKLMKLCPSNLITLDVASELWMPIARVRARSFSAEGTVVLMPEATMNQHNLATPRKDEIWRAWQVASVQAKAIAERVRKSPDQHLGLGVPLANAPHLSAYPAWLVLLLHSAREASFSAEVKLAAKAFKGAKRQDVQQVLETLVAFGEARAVGGGRFAA